MKATKTTISRLFMAFGLVATLSLATATGQDYDSYAGAIDVTSLINGCSADAAYTTIGGTADLNGGDCWGMTPKYNRWFKFTAPSSGMINITTDIGGSKGTQTRTLMALWAANGITQLKCKSYVGNGDDVVIGSTGLTPGSTYYLSIDVPAVTYRGTFSLCISAAVDYDYYEGAIDVTSTINSCSPDAAYTTVGASPDKTSGNCGGLAQPLLNRWFKFTAPASGRISVNVDVGGSKGTQQRTLAALWASDGVTLRTCKAFVASTDDILLASTTLTPGLLYYVSIDVSLTSSRGTFTLCLNDNVDYDFYESALDVTSLINSCSSDAAYSTAAATSDKLKGTCWAGTQPLFNRWFKFNAPSNGQINVTVDVGGSKGTQSRTNLALWLADGITPVKCKAYLTSGEDVMLGAPGLTPGATYYVSVDASAQAYWGTFSLCLSDALTNDYYEGAPDITSLINTCSADAAFTTALTTPDRNAGSCWTSGQNNRWYKFTAPQSGMINIFADVGGVKGTQQRTQLALWQSNGTTEVLCRRYVNTSDDVSMSSVTLTPGATYYLSVDGSGQSYWGTFTLCLSDTPDYDFYQGAAPLTVNACSANAVYSTVNATADRNASSCQGGVPVRNRWFKFNAPVNGQIRVTVDVAGVQGTQQYSQLALWQTDGTTLIKCKTYSAQNEDVTLGATGLTSGNTYYVSVDAVSGPGSFTMCLSDQLDYDYYEGAQLLTMNATSANAAYTTQSATADRNASTCQGGSPVRNRWFKFIAPPTGRATVYVDVGGDKGTQAFSQLALWQSNGTTQVKCASYSVSGDDIGAGALNLTPGSTYYVSVDAVSGFGSFTISVYDYVDYDYFEGAKDITGMINVCSSDAAYTTVSASADGTTAPCIGGPFRNRWFKFKATGSGKMNFLVDVSAGKGTQTRTHLSLWQSNGTTLVGCAASTATNQDVTLNATGLVAGNFYYLSVDSNPGQGTFTLCLNDDSYTSYSFQYLYDARKRMIAKKVPESEWVYMVYDNRDRLVLTQDGNQRTINQWSFTKYDLLNRPVLTGLYSSSATRDEIQSTVNSFYTPGATMGEMAGTAVHGYTNVSFPVVADPQGYLTVTYYDNYKFLNGAYESGRLAYNNMQLNGEQEGQSITQAVGKVTGSKTRVLDGGFTWLWSANHYDDRYRLIQSIGDNYKGGTDITTNVYDFSGKLLKTKTYHEELDIVWTDKAAVLLQGNRLIATLGGTWGTAAAASVQRLPAGQDGWVEVTVDNFYNSFVIGFSETNENLHMNTIDYGIWFNGPSGVSSCVNGTCTYRAGASSGDKLKVERVGTEIRFYVNGGTPIHVITGAPTTSVLVDAALYYTNHGLAGVRTSFSKTSQFVTRTFSYDHSARLLETTHQLNNGPVIVLSKSEYNEVGQLVDKSVHKDGSDPYEQSQDFRYNIRGWLSSVNGSDLAVDESNDDDDDLFGFDLLYNEEDAGLQNQERFNGNISAMKWSANLGLADVKERGYSYEYDDLNRIKAATFREREQGWTLPSGSPFSESGYDYDLNGNILALARRGSADALDMDQLVYDYGQGNARSNKLLKVTDGWNDWKGFKDWTNIDNDYAYDANGNMTLDKNKAITGIAYNYLNLPALVTKGSAGSVRYTYDASGRKLSQLTSIASKEKQVDYVGEYQYEDDVLQSLSHEEGRIVFASREPVYSNAGDNLSGVVAQNATVTLLGNYNGGQTYIRAVSTNTTAYNGLRVMGEDIIVQGGEKYLVRAKAYTTTSNGYLVVFANTTALGPLPRVPGNTADLECWVETVVTIPPGADQLLTAGVAFSPAVVGSTLYVNDFEIIKLIDTAPEYQYYLKDHLGNVRMTFTTKDETESHTAGFEDLQADVERAAFNPSYDNAVIVSSPLYNSTPGGSKSQRLTAASQNEMVGLVKQIKVMPGDVINASVKGKYFTPTTEDTNVEGMFLAAISTAFGVAPTSVGEGAHLFQALDDNSLLLLKDGEDLDDSPKAYLNYILFDENFVPYDLGYDQISEDALETGSDIEHDEMQVVAKATRPGYVYIYLSNENDKKAEVYFDDLLVEHSKSPVVAMDDYYPFGLTFNSYSRGTSSQNQYQFNGKEMQDELDLGWLDYGARMYIPEIGRWGAIDPMSDIARRWSPYNYTMNNPIRYIDPDGMIAGDFYNENGEWLGSDGKDDDKVYQTTNVAFDSYVDGEAAWKTGEEDFDGLKASDDTHYLGEKNEFGLIQLTEMGNEHIGNYGLEDTYSYTDSEGNTVPAGQHGDDWVTPDVGAAFNAKVNELVSEPGNGNLIVKVNDASAFNPAHDLDHQTHFQGKSIDMPFLKTNGGYSNNYANLTAADIALNGNFVGKLQSAGFSNNYSHNGTIPGTTHVSDHEDHLHVAKP